MKLQKLVFFSHGWHWAINNGPLISESVEAWKYGPVIPSLYHKLKSYGNGTVNQLISTSLNRTPIVEDPSVIDLLNTMWDLYSKLSPIQLSNLTHEKGSPWYQTLQPYLEKGMELPKGKDINDSDIAFYFSKKLEEVGV